MKGSQGRNLRQQRKSRPWKTATYWLASSVLLGYHSYIAPILLSRDNNTHTRPGRLHQLKLRKEPKDMLVGQSALGSSSVEVPSSQTTQGLCQGEILS